MHTAILEIRHPNGETELREMLQGTLSIGSEIGEILLPDPSVSGSHARLRLQGLALTYTDVGSSTGSFVEDARLTAPKTLAPGMTVALGESTILLRGFGLKRTSRTEVTVKIHRSMFGLPHSVGGDTQPSDVDSKGLGGSPRRSRRPAASRPRGMPTLLARIALDGKLVPAGSSVAPLELTGSPLNALPKRVAPAPEQPPATSHVTAESDPVRDDPTAVTDTDRSDDGSGPRDASEKPPNGVHVGPPERQDPAMAARRTVEPVVLELGAPHPMTGEGGNDPVNTGEPSTGAHLDTSHASEEVFQQDDALSSEPDTAPSNQRPQTSHALQWSFLLGAVAAAAAFFVWQGGYLLPALTPPSVAGSPAGPSRTGPAGEDAGEDAALANTQPSETNTVRTTRGRDNRERSRRRDRRPNN